MNHLRISNIAVRRFMFCLWANSKSYGRMGAPSVNCFVRATRRRTFHIGIIMLLGVESYWVVDSGGRERRHGEKYGI